jgi:hypothetical protein
MERKELVGHLNIYKYLYDFSTTNPNSLKLLNDAKTLNCAQYPANPYCCVTSTNDNFIRNKTLPVEENEESSKRHFDSSTTTKPRDQRVQIQSSNDQQPEYESCGENAFCQPLDTCQYFKSIKETYKPKQWMHDFFYNRRCSTSAGEILYCCSGSENTLWMVNGQLPNLMPRYTIKFPASTRKIPDQTTTEVILIQQPEYESCGENAFCMPLQDCGYLKYISENNRTTQHFFDNRRCSTSHSLLLLNI